MTKSPRGQPLDPTRYTPRFAYRARAGRGLLARSLQPGSEQAGRAFSSELWCERVRVGDVAARVGTPTYVYSQASIEDAFRRLDRAVGAVPHTICYAVKANSNLEILRLMARRGSGFDIVSAGELYRLRRIGVPGRQIVFSGVGKTREEIREAMNYQPRGAARAQQSGILLFNVESAAELDLLVKEAARRVAAGGKPVAAAIRVNPDVEAGAHPHISTGRLRHKFGVDWEDARKLYLAYRHARWIRWQGISAHIGSQILSLEPFRQALARLVGYVRELARAGIPLRFFDFGGGLGIRYATERPPDITRYARAVARAVRPLGCHLLLEPGRVLVGPAGVLLTRVLYTKQTRGKMFVVVDAAMNDFLRPALYGAVHPVTNVVRRGGRIRADIVGPVCETGDVFVPDWPLEEVVPGDLLAIWGTGAYGFVSASNYNSRRRPAEVLVQGNRFRIIRRRESFRDLLRGE